MTRPPPILTEADLAAWRALVRRVELALAGGPTAAGDLEAACRRASKAVGLPPVRRDALCFQLLRAAQAWLEGTGLERAAASPELRGLAEAVRGQIERLGQPPERPFRADIDG